MADPKAATSPLRGGELNAAVTSALVGIQNSRLGRGPKSAPTFHHGNVIVTLSDAEKSSRMLWCSCSSVTALVLRQL